MDTAIASIRGIIHEALYLTGCLAFPNVVGVCLNQLDAFLKHREAAIIVVWPQVVACATKMDLRPLD